MIIGITGTSGSGKTTLGNILSKKRNMFVIDADKVARNLNCPQTEYMQEIRKTLGEEFFLSDGNLNREKLATEIYSNKKSREKLNKLTFKYVIDEILKIVKKQSSEEKYIFIDAPLLFEAGLENFCDYTISLIANYELKVRRICQRDNITEDVAKKRLSIQQSDEYYVEKSDFVILNNENCNLDDEIERILEKI